MKSFQTLMTVMNMSKDEVYDLLVAANCSGDFIIGNQCGRENKYELSTDKCHALVFEFADKGVSRNRNRIFNASSAEFITFADGDTIFPDDYLDTVSYALSYADEKRLSSVRLNVESLNPERPIKQLNFNKNVRFNALRSFGVWGMIYNRNFLLKNGIKFDENIGPGSKFTHGEDGFFNCEFFRSGGKCCQINKVVYEVEQKESTWFDKDKEFNLVSHGYVLGKIYRSLSTIVILVYAYKHRKENREIGFLKSIRFMRDGQKIYKKEKSAV